MNLFFGKFGLSLFSKKVSHSREHFGDSLFSNKFGDSLFFNKFGLGFIV